MRAYQCSRCDKLLDLDDYCTCSVLGDMRLGHRGKGAAKICRDSFEQLPEKQIWHEKFSWED